MADNITKYLFGTVEVELEQGESQLENYFLKEGKEVDEKVILKGMVHLPNFYPNYSSALPNTGNMLTTLNWYPALPTPQTEFSFKFEKSPLFNKYGAIMVLDHATLDTITTDEDVLLDSSVNDNEKTPD